MAAEVIMIIALALLGWTYLLYPALVMTLAGMKRRRGKSTSGEKRGKGSVQPSVSVIVSVHNEEMVIREKVESILKSDYPSNLLEIIIGSDGSTDETEKIMRDITADRNPVRFIHDERRRGKSAMLNDLAATAQGEILVITDANVIFTTGTLRHLMAGFSHPDTGLCDATADPLASVEQGITKQENVYGRFETLLKRAEGDLWGTMPGPYGGCYAIRRELFPRIPENTLVDDLFVGLTVLGKNLRSFNIPEAIVYEDTQADTAAQFRRRIRIAAGSFQNLFRFGPFPSGKISASFVFISHKVLRWFTPLFLGLIFMTTVILSRRSDLYFWLSAFQLIFIILSALDLVLDRYGKKIRIQRYITQFLLMNAALAAGFVKAVRGIKNGIWEPTKRV